MAKDLVEIKGFAELQRKIKQIPDKVKKKEMLKILRQESEATVKAVKALAPVSKKAHVISGPTRARRVVQPGNLKKSIGKIVGKRGLGKENAVLYVGPRSKGKKNDGWYGHIVEYGHNIYKKGFKRNTKGNRGYNTIGAKSKVAATPFSARGHNATKGLVTAKIEDRVAKNIQKQIDKLSS